jgi:hypothetical protein
MAKEMIVKHLKVTKQEEHPDGIPAIGPKIKLTERARQILAERTDVMKSATARVKELAAEGVRRSAVSFGDVLFGPQTSRVTKAVREWVPGEGEQTPSRVAQALDSWTPKPTDAARTPDHKSTSGFDKPGPTHGAVRVGDGYLIKDPWLYGDVEADPGFTPGEESGVVKPANFKPTNPGPLPNTGEVVQLTKSQVAWAYSDAKAAGDRNEMAAIEKFADDHGFDVRAATDVEWLHGRTSRIKRA